MKTARGKTRFVIWAVLSLLVATAASCGSNRNGAALNATVAKDGAIVLANVGSLPVLFVLDEREYIILTGDVIKLSEY